jgi:flagellar protein FliO/FliZ
MTRFSLLLFTLLALCQTSWAGKEPAAGAIDNLATTGSLLFLSLKVIGGLALVMGLMVLLVIWLKKLGFSQKTLKQGSLIRILDTRMIGPKKYVSVLQIADQNIVVGITDQQITMLTGLNDDPALKIEKGKKDNTSETFSSLLARASGFSRKQ